MGVLAQSVLCPPGDIFHIPYINFFFLGGGLHRTTETVCPQANQFCNAVPWHPTPHMQTRHTCLLRKSAHQISGVVNWLNTAQKQTEPFSCLAKHRFAVPL